jgi:hypothetical protein
MYDFAGTHTNSFFTPCPWDNIISYNLTRTNMPHAYPTRIIEVNRGGNYINLNTWIALF